jgi:hypothetical protein
VEAAAPLRNLLGHAGAQVSVRVAQKMKQKQLQYLLHDITVLVLMQLVFNMIYGNH